MSLDFKVRPFNPDPMPKPRFLQKPMVFEGPLDVEIGCGVGMHSLNYAAQNPHRFLVALEHTHTRFSTFQRSYFAADEPKNLFPIHANATGWITHALSENSVENYFLFYPNPYPKPQDLNKRWHAMPFFERILWTLKPGGSVFLATNERFYFEEAKLYFEKAWGLKINCAKAFTEKDLVPPRTHFEKKYLERGQTCYEVLASKP